MDMNIYYNKPINLKTSAYKGPGEYYDPAEITSTLLSLQTGYTTAGTNPDFDKSAIIDAVYYLKAAAENERNNDNFRQLYNLLAVINESSYIPF